MVVMEVMVVPWWYQWYVTVVLEAIVVMVVMVIGGYGTYYTNHGGGVVAPAKMKDEQKNIRRLQSCPYLLRQNVSFCVSTTPRGMEGCLT